MKTALDKNFIPKEFNRSEALKALEAVGESVTGTCDPIKRLVLNGEPGQTELFGWSAVVGPQLASKEQFTY